MRGERTISGYLRAKRPIRLPIAILMVLGLLVSMHQCLHFDAPQPNLTVVAAATDGDHASGPGDAAPVCHSGHCLSHTNAQAAVPDIAVLAVVTNAPRFGHDNPGPGIADLQLFRPPRA